jgi:hypothetical protein
MVAVDVENTSLVELTGVQVTVSSKPDWIIIDYITPASSIPEQGFKTFNVQFSISEEAPHGGTANVVFLISADQANVFDNSTLELEVITPTPVVNVTPESVQLYIGDSRSFTAMAIYPDGSTTVVTEESTWSGGTDNSFTASEGGEFTITATFHGISGSATITVPSPTAVSISPSATTIKINDSVTFTASVEFDNGIEKTNPGGLSWDPGSSFTGTEAGDFTITATYQGLSGSATVTVQEPVVTSVTVSPGSNTILPGETVDFTATASFDVGEPKDVTGEATWTPGTSFTGMEAGTHTVTAEYGGISGSAAVTVQEPVVTSVTVSPGSNTIRLGETVNFTSTASFDVGEPKDVTGEATWTPGTSFTGMTDGTYTVTATYGSISGSATVTVQEPVVTSVTVSPASKTIRIGETVTFSATANFDFGDPVNVTGEATWSPGSSFKATEGGPRDATITAMYKGKKGTATVTVKRDDSTSGGYDPREDPNLGGGGSDSGSDPGLGDDFQRGMTGSRPSPGSGATGGGEPVPQDTYAEPPERETGGDEGDDEGEEEGTGSYPPDEPSSGDSEGGFVDDWLNQPGRGRGPTRSSGGETGGGRRDTGTGGGGGGQPSGSCNGYYQKINSLAAKNGQLMKEVTAIRGDSDEAEARRRQIACQIVKNSDTMYSIFSEAKRARCPVKIPAQVKAWSNAIRGLCQ